MTEFFVIFIIFILLIFFIKNLNLVYDYFSNTSIKLKDYENFPIGKYNIYNDINHLIEENPNIKVDNNVLIYLINWGHGFGSAITVFMMNFLNLKKINDNIICLPHFSKNTQNFKYHDVNYNNSFFLYFKSKKEIDLSNYKIYFCDSTLILEFETKLPIMNNEYVRDNILLFNDYFVLKKNVILSSNSIIKSFDKKVIIGLHLRSRAQLMIHPEEKINSKFDLKNTLLKLKSTLDKEFNNYRVFIATDVHFYIDIAKEVFNDVCYLDFIERIKTEDDSIMVIDDKLVGYKLGSDILNEVYCLSLCKKVYLRPSNIMYLTTMLNPNIDIEYLDFE
jgi:hypothetical protein